MEAVGGPDEDDSQRVPAHALAEGGAGTDRAPHGGLLLRRGRGAAAWVRPATDEIIVRVVRIVLRSDEGDVAIDLEPELRVRRAEGLLHRRRGRRLREDEPQIAFSFG